MDACYRSSIRCQPGSRIGSVLSVPETSDLIDVGMFHNLKLVLLAVKYLRTHIVGVSMRQFFLLELMLGLYRLLRLLISISSIVESMAHYTWYPFNGLLETDACAPQYSTAAQS